MPVELALYETDDSTLAAPFDFGTVTPGAESTVWSLHLWNGNGNSLADEAREVELRMFERIDSGVGWNQDGEATRDGWILVRLTGGTSGVSPETTVWTPVGYGRPLRVGPIPAEEARYLEIKIAVPAGAATFQGEVKVGVNHSAFATAASLGTFEVGGEGLLSGTGDRRFSELLEGLDGSESGTPDDDVNWTDGIWIHEGEVYVKLLHLTTLDGDDGDGFALASGEAYWATISAGASSTLVVTKSPKGSAPLPNSAREAVPDGEILVAYVHRDFDAAIGDDDIYQEARSFGRFLLETSALAATIHSGEAIIDNRLVRIDGSTSLTLAASTTQTIYLNPDGSFEVATAAAAQARAEPLWEVTTDGSGETARVDLRSLAALKRQAIILRFPGTISGSDEAYSAYAGRRTGRLSFPVPVRAYVSSSGATSGSTIFDVEVRESSSWVTLFTSQGSDDRRPTIAYDSTEDEDLSALPEKTTVEPGAMIRAVADAVASGSPSDGVVVLLLEED